MLPSSGPSTLRAAFDEAMTRGSAHEWEMRATLNRFAFAETDLDRPMSEFSGGQRTRALLARTLLEEPDWLDPRRTDEPSRSRHRSLARNLCGARSAHVRDRLARPLLPRDGRDGDLGARPRRACRLRREAGPRVQRLSSSSAKTGANSNAASTLPRHRTRAAAGVIAELRTHGSHNYTHVRSREKALERLADVTAPRRTARDLGRAQARARDRRPGDRRQV